MHLGESFVEASLQLDIRTQTQKSLQQLLQRNELGFFQLPLRQNLWTQSLTIGNSFASKFSHFIWVGIGGSSLGPKSICQSLNIQNITFVENPDLSSLRASIQNLDLKKTGFIFVSKSGSTIESLTNFHFFKQELEIKKLSLESQALVITELRSSSLFDWATDNQCPILEIPLDVGGRFSVLSAVGQLVLVLGKKDLASFQSGALTVLQTDFQEKVLLPILDFFLIGLQQKDVLTYFWYYCDRTYLLGKWLEQLWAESLAKSEARNHIVSVPIIAHGANDQHSILQQMVATVHRKSVVIHRFQQVEDESYLIQKSVFKETESLNQQSLSSLLKVEAIAMRESQKQIKNSTLEINFKAINEFTLAQYFMTYQLVVGSMGEFMNIDSFNQPGVELGKVITKSLLEKGI